MKLVFKRIDGWRQRQTDVEVLILILIGLFMGTLHLEEDGEAEIFRKLASHLLKFEDTLPPLMMMYHQFHKTMKYCDLEFLLVTFSKYKGGIKGIKSCLHCVF